MIQWSGSWWLSKTSSHIADILPRGLEMCVTIDRSRQVAVFTHVPTMRRFEHPLVVGADGRETVPEEFILHLCVVV
jgi:hypothetical protein